MGNFRQRVGLVHELTQLRRTEELTNRSTDRFTVDQVVRHQVFSFSLTQTFLDSALDAHQTRTELVFSQFADATDTAVAKVINIVNLSATIAQIDQNLDSVENVFIRQRHRAFIVFTTDAAVKLHTTDSRQIVSFFGKEQTVEQGFYRVFGRWLAWAHHAINGNTRRHLIDSLVGTQGLGNISALIQIVGIQGFDLLNARITQGCQNTFHQFVVGVGHDFPSFRMDHVISQYTTDQEIFRY